MSKIIAFYLPQFHEFKENNEFWGKGFTEWTCIRQSEPMFPNHYIRKPNKELGYYCLLDRNIRKYQGELAKKYGVYGFCYYHYWFGYKPIMESPLELMLQDGYPDIPFCLSWANKSWTRRMNGGTGSILINENYGDESEWTAHFNYLVKYFKNPNYIKINNKPLMVIYYAESIHRFQERRDCWNRLAKLNGFDGLFFIATLGLFPYTETTLSYCDAALEFFPNFLNDPKWIEKTTPNANIYDMQKCYKGILEYPQKHPRQFKGTMTGFDNSPRKIERSNIFINSNPELFKKSLKDKILTSSEEFIFIQGWNEWAEGATLEPDEKFEFGFLEAIRDIANNRILL